LRSGSRERDGSPIHERPEQPGFVDVRIPRNLQAGLDGVVSVPVNVVNDAFGVVSADITIQYDPELLHTTAAQIVAGDLWPDATVIANVDEAAGSIDITIFNTDPLPAGSVGSLVDIEFRVDAEASGTTTEIDLEDVSLNEDQTPVAVPPTAGSDPADGLIAIDVGTINLPAGHLELTVTADPTDGHDPVSGEIGILPEPIEWIDEWHPFSVDIWVQAPGDRPAGVAGGAVQLTFNAGHYTATQVEFGPAFGEGQTEAVDVAAGRVTLRASTSATDVGDDHPALLARVHFAPTAVDGHRHELAPPDEIGVGVEAAQVDLVGMESGEPTVGEAPAVERWQVIYDLNNDGAINHGDLAVIASVFQCSVDDPGAPRARDADFDGNGWVDFGDLAAIATNFGHDRTDVEDLVYPHNFRARWREQRARLEQPPVASDSVPTLDQAQLSSVVAAAKDRIEQVEGAEAAAVLDDVTFEIVDLPGDLLGLAHENTIQIDINAAGDGWFVDATPGQDEEFVSHGDGSELIALPGGPASGQVDLLTTVMHELGHLLGHGHETDGVMSDALAYGTRLLWGQSDSPWHEDPELDFSGDSGQFDPDTVDAAFAAEI
jgi:hypothetical protein